MKKHFIVAVVLLLSLPACARNMHDLLREMPDSLLPSLTKNNRLDLVDFAESKMTAEVTNIFGEKVRLDTLTTDFLHLTLSDVSSVELKMKSADTSLPDSADAVVCMVETVSGESCVRLFTSKWTLLKQIELPVPPLHFADSLSLEERSNIAVIYESALLKASLSPDDNTLTVTPSVPLLTEEEQHRLSPCLNKTTLRW